MTANPPQQLAAVEDMLCLALHSASRAMTSRYRVLLEPFGVTYPQYLVLMVLQQEDQSALVSIGNRLRLESSTLSPLVKRLETLQLVTRSRSTGDERTIKIALTEAGRRLCVDMDQVPEQISAATGLDVTEQAELTRTLHRLETNLRG